VVARSSTWGDLDVVGLRARRLVPVPLAGRGASDRTSPSEHAPPMTDHHELPTVRSGISLRRRALAALSINAFPATRAALANRAACLASVVALPGSDRCDRCLATHRRRPGSVGPMDIFARNDYPRGCIPAQPERDAITWFMVSGAALADGPRLCSILARQHDG
jgi:hypothetical protein